MEPYELIRSRRKTLALEITRDCRVVVRAPLRASRSQIDTFVRSHRDWIAKHLEIQRRRAELAPPAPSPEELAELKERSRAMLEPLVARWSAVMGLSPAGMRITAARTRYGSCSGKNSLSFSCFLVNCPPQAVELVVVHELCHIRVKNHGPAFYALLEQYLPDYRERRQLLRSPGIPES